MPLGTPANIQELRIAFSKVCQADAVTAQSSGNMFSMLKNSGDFFRAGLGKEDDAAEIGKGDEFATQTFPTAWAVQGQVAKFLSSEFLAFCLAYGFGNSAATNPTGSVYLHTASQQNLTTNGIEPAYMTVVEQIRAGGANVIVDRAFIGMAMDSFSINVQQGVGRGTSTITADLIGTGKKLEPSGITIPALTQPHELPSASLSLMVNGFDYITSHNFESLNFSWKNNLTPRFVGGGFQSNGTGATATAVLTSTVVTSATIGAGGSGYTVPPGIKFTGGGGSGATGFAVLTAGAVSSIVIVNGGTGYTSVPTIVFDPAGYGTGAIAGSLEMGIRSVSLQITARYVKGSPEIAVLNSLSNGNASFGLTGANIASTYNHNGGMTFPATQFKVADLTAIGNRVGISLDVDILEDPSAGLLTATAQNAIPLFGRET